MNDFAFRDPSWLWLLLAIPVVIAFRWYVQRRFQRAVPYPPSAQLEGMSGRNAYFPWISTTFLVLALAGMILALARPARRSAHTTVTTEGVAILICLDISGSMDAEDFQPNNRIDVARTVIADFVKKRPDDRIGLITFAAMPFLRCPLTSDHRTLLNIVESLKAVDRSDIDGTAIGDALIAAGKRLINAPEKSRVVILLTDGENNRGQFDPIQAAQLLATHKIKVDVVGIGSNGVVPYPIIGPDGEKTYQYVRIGFNENTLKDIAKVTDGLYYNATDAHGLERVFDAINRLEKSKVVSKGYVQYRDYFLWPLGFALLCLVLHTLWRTGPGRVLP